MKHTSMIDYEFAKQGMIPDWYDGRFEVELCATSGTHPCNIWAGFHSREDAVAWLLNGAHDKQTFVENFEQVGEEIYEKASVDAAMKTLGFDFETGDYSEFLAKHEVEIRAMSVLADLSEVFRTFSVFG